MDTFCEQLRYWRKSKGFSQLSLALETGVSSKHISHMENGRSKPSREMVLRLSEALDTPFNTRNQWLKLLGFSDHYTRTPLNSSDIRPLSDALTMILEKQDPHPVIVLDWHWNIMMKNKGFDHLLKKIQAHHPAFSQSANIAELVFDDNGLKPLLSNWSEVATTTLFRIKKEQHAQPGRHDELLKKLYSSFELPDTDNWFKANTRAEPFIYVDFLLGDKPLKFLTTLSSFGTPIDITASELQIEHYYPTDAYTKAFLKND